MPVGALPPAGNGEPERGESIPVMRSTEKAEMVLSSLFATYKRLPVGSNASPNGCWPVGTGAEIGDRAPLLRLKADTLFPATFVATATPFRGGWHSRRGG